MSSATPLPVSAEEERQAFRRAVSLFATGIAVVAVPLPGINEIHGMTINSFTSISLDPPTIMISLKPGRTHAQISQTGQFGVSLLHGHQRCCSDHFSGRLQEAFVPDFFAPLHMPVLRTALAWFDCEVISSLEVCDHTVFFAQVRASGAGEGEPLIFYKSRYHAPSTTANVH